MEDELKLEAMKTMEIDMTETAIGQLEQRKKREVILTMKKMNCDESGCLKTTLGEMDDGIE